MKTASVNDVSSMLNLGSGPSAPVSQTAGNSFQTVFNSQTGSGLQSRQGESESAKPDVKTSDAGSDKAKPGEELQAKDVSRQKREAVKDSEAGTETVSENGQVDEEKLEEVMETVACAFVDLTQTVAQVLDVPAETVMQVMDDMNLAPQDLADPENLSNLFLEAAGAKDSLALLTDGELYGKYQEVMEAGKDLTKDIAEKFDITPGELEQVVFNAEPAGEIVEEEPKITVESEPADEAAPLQPNAEEGIKVEAAKPDENQRSTKEDKKGESSPENHPGNMVLQTAKEQSFEQKVETAYEPNPTGDVDTQDMMRQIMDYMRVQVKADMSNLEMQLHPASLGTLQIQVASKGGTLTANFVTQNESVKAALESQLIVLKQSFEEQGVKVEAIEVTVQTHSFEQNLEQGRQEQREGGEEAKKQRVRRLSLDGLNEPGALDELEEEDRITAEMMAANGTTVDYTA